MVEEKHRIHEQHELELQQQVHHDGKRNYGLSMLQSQRTMPRQWPRRHITGSPLFHFEVEETSPSTFRSYLHSSLRHFV